MLARSGRADEGMSALEEAFTLAQQSGKCYWDAELSRLKGVLLLSLSEDNHAEAETWFMKGIEIARRQQTKSFELRTAMELARLWQRQGRREDARNALAPVYDWFTEGFDTADLKEARALLDELS